MEGKQNSRIEIKRSFKALSMRGKTGSPGRRRESLFRLIKSSEHTSQTSINSVLALINDVNEGQKRGGRDQDTTRNII
jgi:hypothetical protein